MIVNGRVIGSVRIAPSLVNIALEGAPGTISGAYSFDWNPLPFGL